MEVTCPPDQMDATFGLVIPFAVGADAHRTGRPRTVNPYEFGTEAHARFLAGYNCAEAVAEGEDDDVAREAAEEAAASGAARA